MLSTERRKGVLTVNARDGRLFVFLPRALFGGKQKQFSLGLPDTPDGKKEADRKVRAMQADIDLGQFDITLEKYKPKVKQQEYLKVVRDLYPEVSLMDLWNKYLDYKRPLLKQTTFGYLNSSVTVYLAKSGLVSPYNALELRSWLLQETTESMAKRVLTHVCAAFNWGLKHSLLKGNNPYDNMANELKHNYEKETLPNAFSEAEVNAVIQAFRNHLGNDNGRGITGCSYNHYTQFVRFLFLTGCRPGEAVGLQWKHVDPNFRKVTFNGGIYRLNNGKAVRSDGSKNNKIREFPCNQALQILLKAIKPLNCDPESLVFPSPKGKIINYNNFCNKAWKKVVCPIKVSTPYNCRDTFITQQIAKGVPVAVIAKWVDSSVSIIEQHYLDRQSIAHILPM